MSKRVEIALLALICSLFFIVASHNIKLPGLYYDEALDVVPTMQILLGQPVEVGAGGGISIGGRTFPVMISSYVGTVNAYLMLPFFYLLGVNVFSLRFMTIFFGCLTILLYYLFARDLLNRRVAAISALLLAIHPSFVFWSRQGIYVTSVMTFIAPGSLFCLFRWHLKRIDWCLYAGMFLLGLGLSAKLLFLWFIVALAASYYILKLTSSAMRFSFTSRKTLIRALAFNMDARHLMLSALFFSLGAATLIWYNLKTLGTVKVLAGNLITTTSGGVNNLDFLHNLLTEIKAFLVLINGSWFGIHGGSFSNDLYPVLFCVSVIGLAFLVSFHKKAKMYNLRKAVFLFLMFALILIQSCFSVSGLGATHLLILLPLPQIIIALFMDVLYQVITSKTLIGVSVAIVILALAALDLSVDLQYHQALQRSGGIGAFSDAIYDLAEYLEENRVTSPLAVDWGFKNNIQILTKGTVNPIEIFQYSREPNEKFFRRATQCLNDPSNLYLFHSAQFAAFRRYEAFETVLRQANKAIQLEKAFYQRDGTPVYYIYRVTSPGQGYSLWQEGEEYETSFGSKSEDFKGGASNGKCLGMWWGSEASHFALYKIHVAEDIPEAYIFLRYAHPDNRAKKLNVYFDGRLVGTKPSIVLPGSGGWGYEESEWALMGLSLGKATLGEHWIKTQPDSDDNAINLDGFYLRAGMPKDERR